MVPTKVRLLIVDDDPAIRATLSIISSQIGYSVRLAEDGFSALRQIRREQPDTLLSDLCMPNMSGFELLSVVRRQFPAIHAIAMSSAFSGPEIPDGVDADAFYAKGSGLGALLQMLRALPKSKRPVPQPFFMHEPGARNRAWSEPMLNS